MSSEKPIQSRPDASNEAWETTAQWAKAEASTRELSDEVEKNARMEAEAAKRAADAALVRLSILLLVVRHIEFVLVRLSGTRISLPVPPIRPPRRPKRSTSSSTTRV